MRSHSSDSGGFKKDKRRLQLDNLQLHKSKHPFGFTTMSWALFLFMVLSYGSGAHSQPTLTQPLSQSSSLGQTARLSCTVSSNKNPFGWLQQTPGQPPRSLFYGSSRGTGVPDRFSVSESGNTGYLSIGNLQAEDEADYHCYMWPSGGSQWIFGGGTQLIIIDPNQPTSPPNVHLFPPSLEEKESKNKATLVCLVDGFRPPDITVTWEADGTAVSNGVETTKPTKLNDKYVASSYLTVSPSDWESRPNYSCKVTHKGTDYVKSVSHSQCP